MTTTIIAAIACILLVAIGAMDVTDDPSRRIQDYIMVGFGTFGIIALAVL